MGGQEGLLLADAAEYGLVSCFMDALPARLPVWMRRQRAGARSSTSGQIKAS
jgi:hypothetical protein